MPRVVAAATPANWQAGAGVDTADHAIQGNAYFPGDLTINVGDSVTWTARSGEFHTVSFGVPASLSTGYLAAPQGTHTYDGGTDFTSSGRIAGGQSYTLTFTKAGDYRFQCYVHKTMHGTLHVLPAGTPVPYSQAHYNQEIIPQQSQLLALGRQARAAGLVAALSSPTPAVTVGDGQLFSDASDAVLRFLRDTITVHVGDTVTWTNLDPETPHTVTFGPEPPGGPAGAVLPSGTDSTGHATVSDANPAINSGFLGASRPNGTTFRVTFTRAGTYTYKCVLHDDLGMTGTVVVLPNP
jgi:plastocyanin